MATSIDVAGRAKRCKRNVMQILTLINFGYFKWYLHDVLYKLPVSRLKRCFFVYNSVSMNRISAIQGDSYGCRLIRRARHHRQG
jgi:hypothetical protein